MADQKVSDLPSLNGADVDAADLLYIIDSSAGAAGSKKITVGQYQLAPVSGGTANGVVYLDNTKVATSGSGLVFDTSGNLGIGTSSPAARLDVNGPASVTSFTGSTRLGITVKGSTAATDYSGIDFSGNSQIVPTARIAVISTAAGSSLSFGTSNNYATGITNIAMTLNEVGNLGVGSTPSAAAKIFGLSSTDQHGVYGQTQLGTGIGYYGVYGISTKSVSSGGVIGISTNGTTYGILGYNDGSQQWAGYFVGSTYATGTYQGSDARLKENVQPLSGSLQKLTALRPVKFDWKQNSDPERNGIKHDVGLIAQEVLPVLPDVVKEVSGTNPLPDSDPSLNSQLGSFYTIEYTKLIPHLISAIQEQQAIIEDLRARVAALEAE